MLPQKYRFNNLKLRKKLLILYIFAVFIPIVATNIIFYQVTMNNTKNQKMQDIELVLDQITTEFITTVVQAIGISNRFYTDSNAYDFFDETYERAIDYIDAYDIYLRDYNRFSPLYYSIQSITFYTDNPTVLYAGGVHPITEEIRETAWYNEMLKVPYPVVMRTNPTMQSELFSVFRELDYFRTKRDYEKIIRIDINPITMRQIFNNVTFPGNVYLLNEHGFVEYSNDQTINWKREPVHIDSIEISNDMVMLDKNKLPQKYFQNWRIVGTIDNQEILEELYHSRRFIFILAFINFVIPTLVIIFIARSLHDRILRVLKYMKQMKKQNFKTIDFANDQDEIGELMKEFNRMSKTIKTLINEVYIANIDKKDLQLKEKQAQLSALQSQINPHFLFNALETIRMRSLMKDEKETAKIIQNMAKIFRNSLTWGKEWVTVREEMKLVHCFLEIQKYRFSEKLTYDIEVDEEAYDCVIPNLAFLPFVENASIHGIEAVKENGKIHLKVELINGELIYTLTDNGAGMDKEKLAKLLDELKHESSMGESVGIKNVYYRLKLYYKDNFDFSINSTPGEGTTVQLKLKCKGNGWNH